jgi:uncharacterized OB-fold protein
MNELTAGFWDAARRHELVAQRCHECGALRHYPQYLCPQCRSDAWSWTPIEGRGVVYSFTVTHRAFGAAWADRVPYAVATVELDNGIRMVSDLPADDTDDVAIGARVEVYFDDAGQGEVTLPRFRLVR